MKTYNICGDIMRDEIGMKKRKKRQEKEENIKGEVSQMTIHNVCIKIRFFLFFFQLTLVGLNAKCGTT